MKKQFITSRPGKLEGLEPLGPQQLRATTQMSMNDWMSPVPN